MATVVYSWILPAKNEAFSLPQLIKEIRQTMQNKAYEILTINDASTDNSGATLKALTSQIPQLKILSFKSHQGKWAALRAGFEVAKGEIIITCDSDLQDDPKEVNKLLAKFSQGYDLVSGWRKIRHDTFYKVAISRLGNWLASTLTSHRFHDLNSSFKVYQRRVLNYLPKEGSLLRFSLLFAHKLGYKVAEVPVNHRPRLFGKSKFGIIKYLRIIYDLILILLLFSGSGRVRRFS
ncbi:glycosyltransferase family 2 protein [Candidatus Microgenomates bacterium]|nr:glycosyltransferase family 2 protein [Candidatus Microgenomates bacterium]